MLFSRILVAVDGSETSDEVFDVAAQLAKLSGGKLYVIHVVMPLSAGAIDYYDTSIIERLQQEFEERGKRLLSKYSVDAKKKYDITVLPVLAQGTSPSDAILKEATSKAADLIVVGSKGFSGVKQFFIGSVPNSVLHQADIPVLLVK
jgi:nucleotide-binding universal stress UspA family protein